MNDDVIIISIFMALEGVHAYSAFLPSVFTIKTFVKTENGRDMIREGEICASAFLLLLALVTSKLTKSPWPALFGLLAGGAMVGVYEYALCRAPVSTGVATDADFSQPKSGNDDYNGYYAVEK